jgi:hypothetical protein
VGAGEGEAGGVAGAGVAGGVGGAAGLSSLGCFLRAVALPLPPSAFASSCFCGLIATAGAVERAAVTGAVEREVAAAMVGPAGAGAAGSAAGGELGGAGDGAGAGLGAGAGGCAGGEPGWAGGGVAGRGASRPVWRCRGTAAVASPGRARPAASTPPSLSPGTSGIDAAGALGRGGNSDAGALTELSGASRGIRGSAPITGRWPLSKTCGSAREAAITPPSRSAASTRLPKPLMPSPRCADILKTRYRHSRSTA